MNFINRRSVLLSLLAAGWVAAVFAAYYLVPPPLFLFTKTSAFTLGGETAEPLEAVSQLALTLAGWLGTLALTHTLGRWAESGRTAVRPYWGGDKPSPYGFTARERFALRVGLGFGVLGVLMLALGFLRLYHPALAWGMVLAALPFGARPFVADLRAALPRVPGDWAGRGLAAFVALMLGLAFVRALAPPTAWDALVYHLAGPKLYLQAGRIHHDLDLMYLGFPQWGSMVFAWGMLLASPQLAQLFHWTFALLTLALAPGAANRVAPGRGWLAAALCLGVPTAALLAGAAYVEWMTMFAALAAFVCLSSTLTAEPAENAEKDKTISAHSALSAVNISSFGLAGVFAGLAFDAKYTAAGAVLGLAALALLWARNWRERGAFALAASLAVAPYLLKNLALTGNPVYPFFLAGKFWDAARAAWYGQSGTGLPWWQVLIAPWEATVWGIEGAIAQGGPPYSATVGPLLLSLIPFATLRWRTRTPALIGVGIVAGVGYFVWAGQLAFSILLVQTRLLFPALPYLAVLAAAGFDALAQAARGTPAPRLVGALVALALAFTAADSVVAFASSSPLAVIVGAQSESGYLADQLGLYEYATQAVNGLPAGSRVAFLWEPRSFYCAPPVVCEPDAVLDRWRHLRLTVGSADAIAGRWRAEGVTHVLIYRPRNQTGEQMLRAQAAGPLSADDERALQTLVRDYLTLVTDFSGVYGLYKLK